jgi:thiamine-monophosphate kinase
MKKRQKLQRKDLGQAHLMAELGLIDQIRRGQTTRSRGVVLGIGDDCAILRPPAGSEVLVTTDLSLEGRHFRRDLHPSASVGHRCLARGLSDLAAMGATPLAAFLSLALPREMLTTAQGRSWVKGFFAGLQALGKRYGVPLAGGDTAESPDGLVLADITLIGSAPAGRALRRSGGRAGDLLYCTGQLGGAAAELQSMFAKGRLPRVTSTANHPQLFPEPRLAAGASLLKRGFAAACLDLSDGLSKDLGHLCDESDVHAEVEEALLPIHPLAAAFNSEETLRLALNGGEDYELLFSAPADVRIPARLAGVPITRIGHLTRRRNGADEMTIVRKDGRRESLQRGGWEHFSD